MCLELTRLNGLHDFKQPNMNFYPIYSLSVFLNLQNLSFLSDCLNKLLSKHTSIRHIQQHAIVSTVNNLKLRSALRCLYCLTIHSHPLCPRYHRIMETQPERMNKSDNQTTNQNESVLFFIGPKISAYKKQITVLGSVFILNSEVSEFGLQCIITTLYFEQNIDHLR